MKPTPRASVAAVLALLLLLLPARASWGVLGDMQMRGGVQRTQGVYLGGTGTTYAPGALSRKHLLELSALLNKLVLIPAIPPIPEIPKIPAIPRIPTIPQIPTLPEIPKIWPIEPIKIGGKVVYEGYPGHEGFKGFTGFQGFQGFEGFQGYDGFPGLEGIPALDPAWVEYVTSLLNGLVPVLAEYDARRIEERLDRLQRKDKAWAGRQQVAADDGFATDVFVIDDFRALVERRLPDPPAKVSGLHMDQEAVINKIKKLLPELRASLGAGVDANNPRKVGFSFYSPYAPQQIGARHSAIGVTYQYWPYNRDGDEHVDDNASGVYDLSGDWGITDYLAFGISVPYIARADAPEDAGVERVTGIGDPAFRLDWWLTQGETQSIAHAGLQFQVRAPWGSEDVAAIDGEAARQGTGLASTQLGIALRSAIAPRPRFAPRVHARLGYQWATADEVAGAGEVVVGAIWNIDPWRKDKATAGDRRWNLGTWLDFAGTYAEGKDESAWEWRAGVGYIHTGGPFGGGAGRRHMLTLEVQGGIDSPGLHSHPVSVQLGYGFTFERPR